MARQQHSPEEKSKLVLEAIRGERTINEIAAENNIHPNIVVVKHFCNTCD